MKKTLLSISIATLILLSGTVSASASTVSSIQNQETISGSICWTDWYFFGQCVEW